MSNLSLLINLDLHFMLQWLYSISSLIEFILLIISFFSHEEDITVSYLYVIGVRQ